MRNKIEQKVWDEHITKFINRKRNCEAIEVPISWFEGLQNALDKCEYLRKYGDESLVGELSNLLGYLDSIKEFIKIKT